MRISKTWLAFILIMIYAYRNDKAGFATWVHHDHTSLLVIVVFMLWWAFWKWVIY